MLNIGFQETLLLLRTRIRYGIAGFWSSCGVVIVAPFRKVIRKFEAGSVRIGVFEVDYHELFMLVGWKQERRFTRGLKSKKVAVLCLQNCLGMIKYSTLIDLHRCAQRRAAAGCLFSHRTAHLAIYDNCLRLF